MLDLDKREFTKFLAKMVVTTVVGAVVTKVLGNTVPATQKFKLAEMAGGAAGWTAGEKLELPLNIKIDEYFDRRELAQK